MTVPRFFMLSNSVKALDIFDVRGDRCAAAAMGAYELWNQLTADYQKQEDKDRLQSMAFSI
ncbi:hypothetical protein AB8964_00510 [Yersinia enterocolitica]|uniref:hypothetical protein n=1 Tax=Yersinia enterocolitica TaxID=630 RepID=UPI003CFD1D22